MSLEGMDNVLRNLRALGAKMQAEAEAAGDEVAQRLESYAKHIAPWTDRTSNLRNSIKGTSSASASRVVIVVSESMSYGPFVEEGTRRSRAYPALWPTVAANTDTALEIFQRHLRL